MSTKPILYTGSKTIKQILDLCSLCLRISVDVIAMILTEPYKQYIFSKIHEQKETKRGHSRKILIHSMHSSCALHSGLGDPGSEQRTGPFWWNNIAIMWPL